MEVVYRPLLPSLPAYPYGVLVRLGWVEEGCSSVEVEVEVELKWNATSIGRWCRETELEGRKRDERAAVGA